MNPQRQRKPQNLRSADSKSAKARNIAYEPDFHSLVDNVEHRD